MEAYKTLLTTVTPARFKVGQMIGATGLLLGVALAMYRRVDADKKDKYRSMFISTVLAVFLTGVTEPLEFMFMFCALPLYIVYAILQGCAFAMSGIIHLRVHSFGNLEFITRIPMSIKAGLGGDIINFVICVVAFFIIGYFVAYFMIGKFKFATPGRLGNYMDDNADDETASAATTAKSESGKTDAKDSKAERIIALLGGRENIILVDACMTRLRVTVAEPERVRDDLLKQTDSRGIVKKGQGVQVIYGPHVTVIKAKLEEYLETAPNEFAADTVENDTANSGNNTAETANGSDSNATQNQAAGTENESDTAQTSAPVKEEKIRKTAIIYSPVNGIAADLSTAPDEGFAGKMMGDGAVVTPIEGTVYAPADGEVEFIFDTKHAIGFQTDSGIPMLLHMGIDTVKLEGKGFEILVTEGQKVKKGDPMMKLDLEFLTANAPSITSPILDTEPEDNQRIRLLANGEIKAGEPLFAVETLE